MTVRLPRIIGHRGAAAHAPENTLTSIRSAAEQGAPWVEFDVMLTADAVPVLFHDDTLTRTTGLEAAMAETPYARVAELEAGTWFDPAFTGEPVPTLAQALALVLELGVHPDIEIKPTPGRDVESAVRTLQETARVWPQDRPAPFFCAFSRLSLAAFRALRPDWPCALNMLQLVPGWQQDLQALDCTSLHLLDREVTAEVVRQVHEAGYQVGVYTVNEPARARELVAWGVEAIITDSPETIAAALDA